MKDKTLEWAARISDVSAETIKRIAREFATTKPACIPHFKQGIHVMRREGLYLAHAENILASITGNKVSFIVNINIYPDEMACLADIVLPDTTYSERKGLSTRNLFAKSPQISVTQPVIKSLYQARELKEIKTEIANRMGISDFMPDHGKKALNQQLKYLKMTYQDMKQMGLLTFRKRFRPKDLTKLPTISGKIEGCSQLFEEHGYNSIPIFKEEWVLKPNTDYPYYFKTTRSPLNFHATTENIPWIHEMIPENMVWINATKAKALGIEPGDQVKVATQYGEIILISWSRFQWLEKYGYSDTIK